MAFRIRQVDVTADGRRIARDRDLDQPQLSIGRESASDIHLADLAVEPQAARISDVGNRRIKIEAARSESSRPGVVDRVAERVERGRAGRKTIEAVLGVAVDEPGRRRSEEPARADDAG